MNPQQDNNDSQQNSQVPPSQPYQPQPIQPTMATQPQQFQPNVQPMQSPQFPQNGYPTQQYQPAQSSHTSVWGIFSIVLPLIGLALPGLIVGLIGRSKLKKMGLRDSTVKIGIILSSVLLVLQALILPALILSSFSSSQAKARDSVGQNSLNLAYTKLEEFHNTNSYYPEDLNELTGIDAEVIDRFANNPRYRYEPIGCYLSQCYSYTIGYNPETEGERPYVREALN